MREPTARQLEVLSDIALLTTVFGYPPTLREICRQMGFQSTNTLICDRGTGHIDALRRKKCLQKADRTQSRAFVLTAHGRDLLDDADPPEFPDRLVTAAGVVLVRMPLT